MEFFKINKQGTEVNIIFNGGEYIFHNRFYGLLAVATRDETEHAIEKLGKGEETSFTIKVGNENAVGSTRFNDTSVLSMVRRFVTRQETRYIKEMIVRYKVEKYPLDWAVVRMNVEYRK